jgi:hypothetical protein
MYEYKSTLRVALIVAEYYTEQVLELVQCSHAGQCKVLIHFLVVQDIDSGLLRVKQPVVLTLQPVEVGFETVNGGIAVPEILRVALEALTRFNELIHVR